MNIIIQRRAKREVEPIIVRTTRLNNLILGKGIQPALPANAAVSALRRSLCVNENRPAVSSTFADAISREGLLDALLVLYNECDKEALKKRDRNISEFINKYRPIISETRRLRINVDDFEVKALIGKGYFGTVHLVTERATGDLYAMKTIKKPNTPSAQIKEERDIMCQRSSPWITSLQYAFQDIENLYLVMEYLPGGDLLSFMSRHRPFDESHIRFYLAEITEAINALHGMGYVHRDIKPENILIDRFGHLKLADFGNAAALNLYGNVVSMSPVGTPDYIAPELLQSISNYKLTRSLHDMSCDYWSMGIIAYEMMFDSTPFYSENVHETYSKILSYCNDSKVQEAFTYPEDTQISAQLRNLIDSLLTKPKDRLDYARLKVHAFFQDTDWQQLRKNVPPFIPSLKDESDISNFETTRKKEPEAQQVKTKNVPTHEFSGQNLPFLGFSYVRLDDKHSSLGNTQINETARSQKLQTQLFELQKKLQERLIEVSKLKRQLLDMERLTQQNSRQQQMLKEYKQEICHMMDLINQKTVELAECKTNIKVLENTSKIGEENWKKSQATIAEMLRLNRRKYEEAKLDSEQHYEKQIADKNSEIKSLKEKLQIRESESMSLSNENKRLVEQVQDLESRLERSKRERNSHLEMANAEKSSMATKHDGELLQLRESTQHSKEELIRLNESLRETQKKLLETQSTLQATKGTAEMAQKNYDETITRLNSEVASNIKLCHKYMQVEEQLAEFKAQVMSLQTENQKLERELQLAECRRQLTSSVSPYETAPGSMSDLHTTDMSEEQLRLDLEQAQKSEESHKKRATELEQMVEKLEGMLKEMTDKMQSTNKEHDKYEVEGLLERQNEKLEDKLAAVREELTLERQSARTANMNAWRLEKQLEELRAEHKVSQRRLELMEHRLKNTSAEHDSTKLQHKQTLLELKLRDERILKLEEELQQLKADIRHERQKWTKCEEELMSNKSKVVEQFAKIRSLETNVNDAKQEFNQLQAKYDEAVKEIKRVSFELKDEQLINKTQVKEISDLQTQLRTMQRNYHQLKEACHITDTQLTEVEQLLHKKQERVTELEANVSRLEHLLRNSNENISELNLKSSNHEENMKELRNKLERANRLKIEHEQAQQQLSEQLKVSKTQHDELQQKYLKCLSDMDVLKQEQEQLQRLTESRAKELQTLKDENSQLLTQLYYAKEKVENLQSALETLQSTLSAQRADIEELHNVLTEKEQFYLQRNIKADTILSQQKKLIDYLQIKVDDLTNLNKRKKTFVDRLFGVSHAPEQTSSNVPAHVIEGHILHRTLQKELEREKQLNAQLQQHLDDLHKSPVKREVLQEHTADNMEVEEQMVEQMEVPQEQKQQKQKHHKKKKKSSRHEHEFELVKNDIKKQKCSECNYFLHMRQQCWSCKQCSKRMHSRCYEQRKANNPMEQNKENVPMEEAKKNIPMEVAEEVKEKVREQQVQEAQALSAEDAEYRAAIFAKCLRPVFNKSMVPHMQLKQNMIIHSVYEIEEQKLLLLGTDMGLYALHINSNPIILTRIELGMDTDVRHMAVSKSLSKMLFVTMSGTSLTQCDFRQLEARCRSNDSKNALECKVLDLNLSNRSCSETWEGIYISNEARNPIDTMVIAVTAQRIVLLKYDESQQFSPVRAMNTESKVSYVLFTPLSAILASDKFYELDLESYRSEEFLEVSEAYKQFNDCHPVYVVQVSQKEYLLCYMELGLFVDEFGSRSRPGELIWHYTPTCFFYNAPFLYIAHFQTIQIIRLTKSYSQKLMKRKSDADGYNMEHLNVHPVVVHFNTPYIMPVVLAKSCASSVYVVSTHYESNDMHMALLDGRKLNKLSGNKRISVDSMTSDATSLTTTCTYEEPKE